MMWIRSRVTAELSKLVNYGKTAYSLHHQHCYVFFLLVNILLMRLVDGTIAILANQGVTETLRIILSGNNAFVIAYAVANL